MIYWVWLPGIYRNGFAAPSPFAGSQALGPFPRICAELWAGCSGQEQQEPLEAQQGLAQVEPRGGSAPQVNCQQQSWHSAHCLLLINALLSRAERLCSSEGWCTSAELVAPCLLGPAGSRVHRVHRHWHSQTPMASLPWGEQSWPCAGSQAMTHLQWDGQCFHLGEATSTLGNPSWLLADPSSSHRLPVSAVGKLRHTKAEQPHQPYVRKDKACFFQSVPTPGITVIFCQLLQYRDLYEIVSIPLKQFSEINFWGY